MTQETNYFTFPVVIPCHSWLHSIIHCCKCNQSTMLEMEKQPIRKKRVKPAATSSSFMLPTTVVCHPSATAQQSGAIEAGVLVSIGILLLYLLGFYETLWSLPEVPSEPRWSQHLGQNVNLARPSEWDSPTTETTNTNSDNSQQDSQSKKSSSSFGEIPVGQWPVSVKDEPTEELLHPGDLKTIMSVPKLWSPPVHHNQRMSPETAAHMGTCAEAGQNAVRGPDCPPDQRTIYLGIASYRDYQCRLTVESAFSRAKNPDRMRVGVVDQIIPGEDVACNEPVEPCDQNPEQALCKYKDQVDVYTVPAELSIGPVFARHLGHRLYRGEYYATQSDAHVTYTLNWDADIIAQMEATKNEMAVLTTVSGRKCIW